MLDTGEVSTFKLTGRKASDIAAATTDGNTAITITNGSSITVSGKTITAVKADYTAATFSSIKTGIMGAAADTKVTIYDVTGSGKTEYTIVENLEDEDETTNSFTRESIIAKIKEGDEVEYTPKDQTTGTKATAAGVDAKGDDTISATEAYRKMADELVAASSIGADTAAKVVNKNNGTFTITQGTVSVKDSLSFNLHVGSDADMTNKITVDIDSMSAAGLGIKNLNVADDTGTAATYAIDAIADAISKVSAQRSALGAVQNRLEHTINNLDNVVENTTSAESRIRDTDMAEEMVEYSKNNILAQAGQSMLAQANQSNQGVLSLLQ
jgi:flagellin